MPADGRWSEQPREVSTSFYCLASNVSRSVGMRTYTDASREKELAGCYSNIRVLSRHQRVKRCEAHEACEAE